MPVLLTPQAETTRIAFLDHLLLHLSRVDDGMDLLPLASWPRSLRLDTDTIARRESDRQSQTAALDLLLRVIRDLPGALDYLRPRLV